MREIWRPNVTVAAIIEREGRFLMVEENTDDGIRFNQPAGHLDAGESLVAACVRETLEETAWHFRPNGVVGIYQWPHPADDITYLRFAFAGRLGKHEAGRLLPAFFRRCGCRRRSSTRRASAIAVHWSCSA